MTVPLLDLTRQNEPLLPEMRGVFEQVVLSGRYVLGTHVEVFEQRLAACCGAKYAVGVSSGTDALLLSLMAMKIGPGDEVITSPFTFFATAGCIARAGARPVFVDIDPTTFNLDAELIEAAITPKTKAIIPVHLYGQAAEMSPIMQIARQHGLKVIEDAAQAIGAKDAGGVVGSLGDVGCFSFYPTKNLSTLGDAGACTTNAPALAERLVALRVHGQEAKYHHTYVGGNFRIDALHAALLSVKLPHLDGWTDARRANAQRYSEMLAGLPVVSPVQGPDKYHVYNQYTIRVLDGQRDPLCEHLKGKGIGHEVYYPIPLYLQPCFAGLGLDATDFPQTQQACREVLSLPIYPELAMEEQGLVIAAIRSFFK